ncbi:MAG: CoA transferase [Pseudolabrys sp.]|nr:CoA transferase [Pseudolabrys sp.]
MKSGPLVGVRVIDLSRLAPGPYATMLLADLGAEVIVVGGGRAGVPIPELSRGKSFISLDPRTDDGRAALHALVRTADVLVEGFRPGVASRIGAGYDELSALNPRLIYCSLTGYGQSGPRSQEAGHDINYVGLSGLLGAVGPADRPPLPPLNLVADFAGGSMVAAFGIVSALYEREKSGRGQFIDAAMVDGCLSMMAMHFPLWKTGVMPARGEGLFAAPYYRTYECSDGKFVAVGALERGFFVALWSKLGLGEPPDHFDMNEWPGIEHKLGAAFRAKTRNDWAALFIGSDACVTAVLTPDEVMSDAQFGARHADAGAPVPVVPQFARTPGQAGMTDLTDTTRNTLGRAGVDADLIARVTAAQEKAPRTGLDWPPEFKNSKNKSELGERHEGNGPGHIRTVP